MIKPILLNGKNVDIILIDTEYKTVGGDYYFSHHSKEIDRYGKTQVPPQSPWISKVIASTNNKHELPQLSASSIDILIGYYNEYGKFPEEVEYVLTNEKEEVEILIP